MLALLCAIAAFDRMRVAHEGDNRRQLELWLPEQALRNSHCQQQAGRRPVRRVIRVLPLFGRQVPVCLKAGKKQM